MTRGSSALRKAWRQSACRRERPRAQGRGDEVLAAGFGDARPHEAREEGERSVRQARDGQGEVREAVREARRNPRERGPRLPRRAEASRASRTRSVCRSSAAQKIGIEYSAKRTTAELRSKGPSGRPPAATPRGIAIARVRKRARPFSASVAGRASRIRSRHGPPVHEGFAEVEANDAPEPLDEPLRKWPVESVQVTHLRPRRRRDPAAGVRRAQRRGGAARREVHEQKDDDDDPEERRDRESDPPDEEAGQFLFSGSTESSGRPHHDSGPGQNP